MCTQEIVHDEEQMHKAEDSPTVLSELTSYDPSEDVHLSASEIVVVCIIPDSDSLFYFYSFNKQLKVLSVYYAEKIKN